MAKKETTFAVAILVITWVIFFSRTLFAGQVYFLDDLKIIFYPLEHVYGEFQRSWSLPEWSPLFGFGHPLLAWGQLGFFTPLHVLLRAVGLHPLVLLQVSILSYFALGLGGMYWFLSRQRLHPAAAALGALVFVFSGFHVGHLNHVNFYVATMVLPFLLVAIDAFVERPNLRRAGIMAAVAAIVPLSGQPQISLYTLVIAALYGIIRLPVSSIRKLRITSYGLRVTIFTLLAGTLSLGLASFAILPLVEFLPNTERASDLPQEELFEFSYPPRHTITLVFPFFFGNHDNYWGAKNFQELSAYVGIIPLLLAGAALAAWQRHRALRVVAIILITSSMVLALGIYSPLYRWLVHERIITALAIPGRFVFFFDVGVALLAAVGLNDLLKRSSPRQAVASAAVALGFTGILLAPSMPALPAAFSTSPETGILLLAGAALFATAALTTNLTHQNQGSAAVLVIVSAATLVTIGWNYTPLTSGRAVLTSSPITQTLQQESEKGLPPRLYAAQTLPLTGIDDIAAKPTDAISTIFSVHQPLVLQANVRCLRFPVQAEPGKTGTITLALRRTLTSPPVHETTLSVANVADNSEPRFCLPRALRSGTPQELYFSATSSELSNIKLFYKPTASASVYFVRLPNPSAAQLQQSQKNGRLVLEQELFNTANVDGELLMRHLQVTSDTSSARWIGALSIASFRAFIEDLFANDRPPFNGDGVHALVYNKKLVDMSGITHFTQAVADDAAQDSMTQMGYPLIQETHVGTQKIRLYENPHAFPKAFLVQSAVFEPDDAVTRHRLTDPDYAPDRLIYVNGPTPPADLPLPSKDAATGTAVITKYEPTQVDIAVTTPQETWLVLTDSSTPQWQTFVDDTEQRLLVANTVWRTTRVPAGEHTVSFRYESAATELAKKLTLTTLVVTFILLITPNLLRLTARGR